MTSEIEKARVKVRFDGLMIGRYDEDERVYEIGILKAPGHELSICYQISASGQTSATRVTDLAGDGRFWSLEIEGEGADTRLFSSEKTPKRLEPPEPDTPESYDWRWLLNLESADFPEHPKSISLRVGQFQRIIHIKNGIVYCNQLTKRLRRKLKDHSPEDFGVASDQLGVALDVRPGQEVVLRNNKTKKDIFRIRKKTEEDRVSIFIYNVPPKREPTSSAPSHFPMYYEVLEIPSEKQYDFLQPDSQSLAVDHARHTGISTASLAPTGNPQEYTRHDENETRFIDGGEGSDVSVPKCFEAGNPGMICGTTHLSQYKWPLS